MSINFSLSARAFGLGFICGMRSMLGPALMQRSLAAHESLGQQPDALLKSAASSPLATFLLPSLAVGEMIGDKLPAAPNRTNPPSVVFRSLSGAAVGAALYDQNGQGKALGIGALLGVAGALAGTYALFYLRREAGRKTPVPDAVWGLAEDAAALGAGLLLTGRR